MNPTLISKIKLNRFISLPQLINSFIKPTRLNFSSHFSSSPSHSKSSAFQISNDDLSTDVTTQELKNRIERYLGGDMEALPSIFEGILARKLSGKHDETYDELMEEFRSNTQKDEDQQVQSDEDLTDSDEELSD